MCSSRPIDGLFVVTAVITAVGIGPALLLRTGPAPEAEGGAAPVEMGSRAEM